MKTEPMERRRPEKEPRYWLTTACTLGAVVFAVWITVAAIAGWIDQFLKPVFVAAGVL